MILSRLSLAGYRKLSIIIPIAISYISAWKKIYIIIYYSYGKAPVSVGFNKRWWGEWLRGDATFRIGRIPVQTPSGAQPNFFCLFYLLLEIKQNLKIYIQV